MEIQMTLTTTRWNIPDHLKTTEDIAEYLDTALEDGDPALLKEALGVIAREAGLGRSNLYQALSL